MLLLHLSYQWNSVKHLIVL